MELHSAHSEKKSSNDMHVDISDYNKDTEIEVTASTVVEFKENETELTSIIVERLNSFKEKEETNTEAIASNVLRNNSNDINKTTEELKKKTIFLTDVDLVFIPPDEGTPAAQALAGEFNNYV
jgi:hypothetical protein